MTTHTAHDHCVLAGFSCYGCSAGTKTHRGHDFCHIVETGPQGTKCSLHFQLLFDHFGNQIFVNHKDGPSRHTVATEDITEE